MLMNSIVYNYIIQSSSNTPYSKLRHVQSCGVECVCASECVVSDVLIYFVIDEATTLFIIKHL